MTKNLGAEFMKTKMIKIFFLISGSIFFAANSFATEAPVFDADHYPPQFDGQPLDESHNAKAVDANKHVAASPASKDEDEDDNQDSDDASDTAVSPPVTLSLETKNKIDALQTEVQSLRGQVEELSHNLQQLQTQQRSQYVDLDTRINALHVAPVASVTKPAEAVLPLAGKKSVAAHAVMPVEKRSEQPNVAEEQQTYQVAYDLIKQAKYDQAIAALQKMLSKYPAGQFAANAHYWLGELYGLQGKNKQAADEFSIVLQQYPDSPKVPDAQLKIGLIFAAQQKWSAARLAFKKVINHYPGTASSRLAAEQLKQIKVAGH